MSTPPPLPQRSRTQTVPTRAAGRPGAHVQQIINGAVSFSVLHTLADLCIADLLADGPRSVTDLAGLLDADPDALRRILRAATALGLLRADKQPDTYSLTPEGRTLRGDLPDSMLPAVLMTADPQWMRALAVLPDTVRAGKPALPQTPYEYLAANPGAKTMFHWLMQTRTAPVAAAIAGLNFEQVRTVVDVGGGHGTILTKILHAHPHCTGILLERPDVAQEAGTHLATLGLYDDRVRVVAGDFFDSVPAGGDVYLLANVLHNWCDAAAGVILSNVRKALEATGGPAQVWCVDLLHPAACTRVGPPPPATILDVRMLSLFEGGRERTREEYRDLLARHGLETLRIDHMAGMYLIVAGLAR